MTAHNSTTADDSGKPKPVDRLGRPMKHGMAGTAEYRAWQHMLDRCYNPNSQRFDRYGARGIRVCDRWKNSFEAFHADMGPRPSREFSIDRIDNDGDYEVGNCRWASRTEQNSNRGDNVFLEHDGRRQTLSAWARETGIGAKTLEYRIKAGWTVEQVLTRAVAPCPCNDSRPPVDWDRGPRRLPRLSDASIAVLKAMVSMDWIQPFGLVAVVENPSRVLGVLVGRGLVDAETVSKGAVKSRHRYRISEAGRSEVVERIEAERLAMERSARAQQLLAAPRPLAPPPEPEPRRPRPSKGGGP